MTKFKTASITLGAVATAVAATFVAAEVAGADASDLPTAKACATAAGYLRLADTSGHCPSGDHALTLPDAHLGQTYQNVANFTMIDTDPQPYLTIPAGKYQVTWSAQNSAEVNEGSTHSTYTVAQTCRLRRSSGLVYDTVDQDLPLGRINEFTARTETSTADVVDISATTSIVLQVVCTGTITDANGAGVDGSGYSTMEFTKMSAVRIGTLASHIDSGFARHGARHTH